MKILSKSQAEAIYRAMCELNNIGGVLTADLYGILVKETDDGIVIIRGQEKEFFWTQNSFAAAYGIE